MFTAAACAVLFVRCHCCCMPVLPASPALSEGRANSQWQQPAHPARQHPSAHRCPGEPGSGPALHQHVPHPSTANHGAHRLHHCRNTRWPGRQPQLAAAELAAVEQRARQRALQHAVYRQPWGEHKGGGATPADGKPAWVQVRLTCSRASWALGITNTRSNVR